MGGPARPVLGLPAEGCLGPRSRPRDPGPLRLLRSLITDRSTPLDVRIVLAGLMVWIVSPIDLIPEFIPVLGPLDDVVVAIVALRYTRRRLGIASLQARWSGSPDGFALLVKVIGSN